MGFLGSWSPHCCCCWCCCWCPCQSVCPASDLEVPTAMGAFGLDMCKPTKLLTNLRGSGKLTRRLTKQLCATVRARQRDQNSASRSFSVRFQSRHCSLISLSSVLCSPGRVKASGRMCGRPWMPRAVSVCRAAPTCTRALLIHQNSVMRCSLCLGHVNGSDDACAVSPVCPGQMWQFPDGIVLVRCGCEASRRTCATAWRFDFCGTYWMHRQHYSLPSVE